MRGFNELKNDLLNLKNNSWIVALFVIFIIVLAGAFWIIRPSWVNHIIKPATEATIVSVQNTVQTSTPEESARQVYVIGISQASFAEPWRSVANSQYKEAAAKHQELKIILLDGRQDNNKQISDIQSLINQKVDLIIASPNEAKPLTAVLSKAYRSGIPVILVDRKIEGDDYTQFIGADNTQIGFKAGQWVVKHLGQEGGNIVELTGSPGTSAQLERHDGFMAAIEPYPQIKIIDSQSMDWIYDKAIAVMEGMLKHHKDIDVVYSHNDPGAEGAYKAASAAYRANEMVFVGIDALTTQSGGIKSVMEGRIDATYIYPTGSNEAIESAYRLLVEKQEIPKELILDTLEITRDNATAVFEDQARFN
jgi:ribose transport system substrate-binding protein